LEISLKGSIPFGNPNLIDYLCLMENDLMYMIADIISDEVYTRNVPYSDDVDVDPNSIDDAAKRIVNMLKEKGLIK